jgi:hypothetical protein
MNRPFSKSILKSEPSGVARGCHRHASHVWCDKIIWLARRAGVAKRGIFRKYFLERSINKLKTIFLKKNQGKAPEARPSHLAVSGSQENKSAPILRSFPISSLTTPSLQPTNPILLSTLGEATTERSRRKTSRRVRVIAMLGLRGLVAASPVTAPRCRGRCSAATAATSAPEKTAGHVGRLPLAIVPAAAASLSLVLWSSPGTHRHTGTAEVTSNSLQASGDSVSVYATPSVSHFVLSL